MQHGNSLPFTILQGDCRETLKTLPDSSVHCCVTSPPYFGLRDYGCDNQIGLEETPDAFVAEMVAVFREVWRVLRDDGTLWLNLGDSYAGSWGAQSRPNGSDVKSNLQGGSPLSARQIASHPKGTHTGSLKKTPGCKPKDLIGIPWRVAFALQADGWYLRQEIIWHKPNPMPESVTDRCTKAHEQIFLLSKSPRYYFDAVAIQEPSSEFGKTPNRPRKDTGRRKGQAHVGIDAVNNCGVSETRNRRSVWTVSTKPYKGAHFATFPPELIKPCVLAGCPEGGTVLDPFGGSGTTAQVAIDAGCRAILCELNPEYVKLIRKRLEQGVLF